MIIRKSEDRGRFKNEWLNARHSFSFSSYMDRNWMHFGSMRVLNHDQVQPSKGFLPHSHQDMEIITYVIQGEIEHADSMGNKKIVRAGEVQRMSAGTGVTHSEMNPSSNQLLELFQIWIYPKKKGLDPGYEQKQFSRKDKLNILRLLVSPSGENGSVSIHQNARILGSVLEPNQSLQHDLTYPKTWVQVAKGEIEINGQSLRGGDGAGFDLSEKALKIVAGVETEFILIELEEPNF